jgi:putative membrane protein insertion efficiency factor
MNKLCIKVIKFYQSKISPNSIPRCRYRPSCSNYGLECYQKFGFFKASFLTFYRILRCNPLSKGGYDPVPLSKIEKQLNKFFNL